MALISSYGVSTSAGSVFASTSTNASQPNILVHSPGTRHFSLRPTWELVQPNPPATPGVYNFSDYSFTHGGWAALWNQVHVSNAAGFDTLCKIMPILGTFYPDWVINPTFAGSLVLDTITKLQVTPGGAGCKQFVCPLFWQPALRTWARNLYKAFNDYGETNCPGSGGAFHTGTHKIKDHWYAFQSTWPMVDNNTEMAEDFENHPANLTASNHLKLDLAASYVEAPVTGQFATTLAAIGLPAQGQVVTLTNPLSQLAGQVEGLIDLRVHASAPREIIYCLDAESDGAGGTRYLVTPPAITGLATGGRGWCGGFGSGGAYSLPPTAFTAGTNLVDAVVRDNTDKNTYGDPGAANRQTFVYPGGRTETGIFEAGAVNQNMWARKGTLDSGLYVKVARDAQGRVIRSPTAVNPNTLNNRLDIYTRCWIDSAEDANELVTNTATRKIYIWQMLGKVWGVKGATKASPNASLPVDPTTYLLHCPDNDMRDYLTIPQSGQAHPPLYQRVVIGHTNLTYPLKDSAGNPTPGGANFQSETDYEHCDFHTIINRGVEIAIQHESSGAGAESDDCVAALEWALKHWGKGPLGPALRWFEFGDDRATLPIVARDGTVGKITNPALAGGSGNVDIGVTAFFGTTIPPSARKFAAYCYGHIADSAFTPDPDPALAGGTSPPSLALEPRMQLIQGTPTAKSGTGLILATLSVTGAGFRQDPEEGSGTSTTGGPISDIAAGIPTPTGSTVDEVTWIDVHGDRHPMSTKEGVCVGQATGRFAPPVILTEQPIPSQSGAIITGRRYGVREIAMQALFMADGPADIRTLLRDWVRQYNMLDGDGILEFRTPVGDTRIIAASYSDGMTLDETQGDFGMGVQKAVPVFRAAYPFFLDADDTVISYKTTAPERFFPFPPLKLADSNTLGINGLRPPIYDDNIPYDSPIMYDSTDQAGGAIIDNTGDLEAWPVWTIHGPGQDLTLGNRTSGKLLKMVVNIAPTDTLVIDTRPRHKFVVLNGTTNLFSALVPGSSLWPLLRGKNDMQVEFSNTDSSSEIDLAYRRQWLSV